MSRPAPDSASASSSHLQTELSDDDLDRRLQQRLAKLQAHPSAIQVSLPPPTAEQLEARLKRLAAADTQHSNEADLQRRLERLSGATAGGGGTSNNSSSSSPSAHPSLHSASDLALAGHSSRPSESDQVEQLLSQTRQHLQLSNGTGPTASASASSSVSAAASSSLDSADAASPPPPSPAEVAQFMRQLSSLPDADILPPVHGLEEEESGSDAEVDEIVRQAMDEARMS